MKFNKRLLPIKAHYFFQNGGSAPIAPFLSVIGKDLGFSATIVGLVLTAIPLTSLLVKPVVGALADKFRIHKTIFISLIVANVFFFFCIQWLPSLPIDHSVELLCSDGDPQITISTSKATDECFVTRLFVSTHTPVVCLIECSNWHAFLGNGSLTNFTGTDLSAALKLSHNTTTKLIFDVLYFTSGDGTHSNSSCSNSPQQFCDLLCTNPLLQEIVGKPTVTDAQVFSYPAFWMFAVCVLIARVATSCVNSLGDSICFKLLGDRPNDYGYQRMWGAAGWGLIAFITGVIVDKMSEGKFVKDFTAAYYLSAFLMLVDIVVASKLKCSVNAKSPNIFANVQKILTGNPRFLLFLVIIVFCGIFSALIWAFLFWFIEEVAAEDGCSDLSWVKTLDGLTLAVHCYLGEIPFFWISGWMLKHVGHAHCMTIVLLAFSVRFIAYYFLTSAWWILPIEILNGITFATFYSTMTTYANALTPPGMQGTIQGFVAAVFEIGIAIGSVSGGYLYDRWGGRVMYEIGGLAAAALAVVHILIQIICGAEVRKANGTRSIMGKGEIPPEQHKADEEEF
uniref:Major facilitator superfamily domain-containing protein 6 n=1 Tax=Lygus hesperus TaxID=30085 RepID=A0A0A9XIF4_LYGHE